MWGNKEVINPWDNNALFIELTLIILSRGEYDE